MWTNSVDSLWSHHSQNNLCEAELSLLVLPRTFHATFLYVFGSALHGTLVLMNSCTMWYSTEVVVMLCLHVILRLLVLTMCTLLV